MPLLVLISYPQPFRGNMGNPGKQVIELCFFQAVQSVPLAIRGKRRIEFRIEAAGIGSKITAFLQEGINMIDRSKKLPQVFSLSQYNAESISASEADCDDKGPAPLVWQGVFHRVRAKEILGPVIRYREFSKEVFRCWVFAINKTANKVKIDGIPEDIDLGNR